MTGEDLIFYKTKNNKYKNEASFENFHDAFDHYGRKILLLGEPGAGKTVTLLAFARDAVAACLTDPAQPLPVFASITTWNSQRYLTLDKWLAENARDIEQIKGNISEIIQTNQILFLLDGLDELGAEKREENPDGTLDVYDPRLRFIDHLNLDIKNPQYQIIVTCRNQEYATIGEKVALNGAVTLNPLNDTQIRDYLSELPELLEALENDTQLYELARTPLILSLFTVAYAEATEEERKQLRIITNNLDLRDKVFETYIQKSFRREASKLNAEIPFSEEDIFQGLGMIALVNVWDTSSRENSTSQEVISRVMEKLPIIDANLHKFLEIARKCYFLVKVDEQFWRFIHLLFRDYLAFRTAMLKLRSSDIHEANNAAEVLGQLRDERAFQPLYEMLSRPLHEIPSGIIEALGKFGNRQVVEPIIRILLDESASRRLMMSAINALANLRDNRAIGPLTTIMLRGYEDISGRAAEALGNIGDPCAFEALIEALSKRDSDLAYFVIGALGKLGDVRAVPHLIPLIRFPPIRNGMYGSTSGSARSVLMKLGVPEGLEAVKLQVEKERHEELEQELGISIAALRARNEQVFQRWQILPDGNRFYWRYSDEMKKSQQRIVRITDVNEIIIYVFREFYTSSGQLLQRYEIFPLSDGRNISLDTIPREMIRNWLISYLYDDTNLATLADNNRVSFISGNFVDDGRLDELVDITIYLSGVDTPYCPLTRDIWLDFLQRLDTPAETISQIKKYLDENPK